MQMILRHLKTASEIFRFALRNPQALYGYTAAWAKEDISKKVAVRYGFPDGLPTVDISDVIDHIEETVEPYAFLGSGSTVMDLLLLRCLAARLKPCTYLEIGTWRGESVANVAKEADKCITLSYSDEMIRSHGLGERELNTARFYSKQLGNVKHIGADSITYDFSAFKKSVDLVFIDGDHSREAITRDTMNAYQLLRDDDSVIIWHDYRKISPEGDICWETLAGILDGLARSEHGRLYHVSNTLCAIYTTKPHAHYRLQYPELPKKTFSINIRMQKETP